MDLDMSTADSYACLRSLCLADKGIVTGGGCRWAGSTTARLEAKLQERADEAFDLFLQHAVTPEPGRQRLFLFSSFDFNGFTAWVTQPNARLLWPPAPRGNARASLSRSSCTAFRGDRRYLQPRLRF